MAEKLSVSEVYFKQIPPTESGELSDQVVRKCGFCEKRCEFVGDQLIRLEKLSGPERFFCPFCLRHGLHTRANRNVLILSFRSIVGHFYQQNYLGTPRKMWISEIEDCVESHYQTGIANPVFIYDPETMLWFIDFSKIGDSKKKLPLDDVLKTVEKILESFHLPGMVKVTDLPSMYLKYKSAIEGFYHKRYRPDNRRMLIPTLSTSGCDDNKCGSDRTRSFVSEDLKCKK